MQKRKIDDAKIWEAYNRLILGESLTQVAKSEDINLDRGTLRKYIEEVVVPALDADRKAKFEQVMNGNFRGNSTEQKRLKRNNKRKEAEERIKESEEMKALVGYGVTPAHIEDLYQRLKTDKHTSVSRDTYILKCLEHLKALTEIGFTTEQVFSIFMRRPRLFTGDASKIIGAFNRLAQKCGSTEIAIQKLTEDPWTDLREKESKVPVQPKTERAQLETGRDEE